jgi:hypothetical protein
MEGLDSPSYSILNKKGNLATPIPSGFMTPKLVLNIDERMPDPTGIPVFCCNHSARIMGGRKKNLPSWSHSLWPA